MTRKIPVSPAPAPADEAAPEIVLRPDGFYWLAADGGSEVGPFESYELAAADRDAAGEEGPEPGESLAQAEDEIGINDWIDEETGLPAEGQSPPHLDQD